MKNRSFQNIAAGLLLLFAISALSAMADEPTTAATPAAETSTPINPEDEVVYTGCFFEVTPDAPGYVASDTVSCSRSHVELKDIGASVIVVTEEFLKDLGVTSAKDLLFYTPEAKANPPAAPLEHPRMEVDFVLDTTGSMEAMIGSAKQKIWSIANKLMSAQPTPEIRFGLVGYRDRGDEYVTKVQGLSANLDEAYEHLSAFVASAGGDEPESVNEALDCALKKIEWSTERQVLRVIFLVGDAPPHMDYADDVKWSDTCREAKARGILINTLQCGSSAETERVWRAIAGQADGAYAAMLQEGRATAIETRFDRDIVGLTRALNETIIPYGTSDERATAGRNGALLEAMSIESIADRATFLSRTDYGSVIAGKGDLVVELMSGRLTLAAIDPQLLDPAIARLPVAERNAKIQKMVARRRTIQADLQTLLDQRETVVAKQMKAATDSEDILVLSPFEVLQEQAESKGYRFTK